MTFSPANTIWVLLGEEHLGDAQDALLPRHAVGNAAGAFEALQIREIPLVIPQQGVLVAELRVETELLFGLFDADEGVLARGLVNPLVERREVQLFEKAQRPDDRLGGEAADFLDRKSVV